MMIHRPNCKSILLRGYGYSQAGAYFVTICTKDRKCLFGDIADREMALNNAGETLGIRLLDHIIFSHRGYYSFLESAKLDC